MQTRTQALIANGRELFKSFQRNETQITAASMAYAILFALVPLLIFIAALSGFVSRWIGSDDTVSNVTDFTFRHLPESTAAALRDPIEAILRKEAGGLLSVGAVLALWGARSVIGSAMRAVNKAYGVEDTRGWLRINAIALGLTFGLALTAVIASASVLLGSRWGDKTADRVGLGKEFADVWSYARWPLIGVLLVVALVGFYQVAPAVPTTVRLVLPGAIFCIVGWALAIFGISFYFSISGSYAAAYGILGGLLAFVFWLFVMSLVFALGAEINALVYRHALQEVVPPTAVPTVVQQPHPQPSVAAGD
jgi:membrane protein